MSEPRDPYEVLGVSKTASAEEIRKAYKRLARKHHPDVNPGDAAAEDRFKEASAAYELLESEEKRKLFDEFGHQAASPGFDPEQARAYKAWQHRQGATGGRARGGPRDFEFDLSDLFGDVFAGGGAGRARGARAEPRPRPGADVTTELRVAFADAVLGADRSFRMTLPDGKGGQRTVSTQVKIPPGVREGQKLRLRGRGLEGERGGPKGDLFITVHVEAHAFFKRDGADILLDLPVTVGEAMRGAQVEVPTLGAPVKLSIPAGAQSGQKLRLRGKGGPGGDLLVQIMIQVPPHGDAVEDAAKALDTAYVGSVRAHLEGGH